MTTRRGQALGIGLLVCFVTISTRSFGSTGPTITTISVTLANSTLTQGATTQATATATYSDGSTANATTRTTAGSVNWTHIQGANGFNSTTATTASATLNNVGLGHIVVCGVISSSGSNDTIASVKDGNNNDYTKSPSSPTTFLNPVGTEAIYYNLAPPVGATTITVTWNQSEAADSYEIFCDEFNPTGGTVALDKDAVNANGGPGTAINTPSIMPSNSNELLYAVGNPRFAITGVNGPWSTAGGGITDGTSGEYILNSGAATAVNWTANQSGSWSAIVMALSLTASSAGPGTVWTETDVSGSGVATVSNFGLVTANNTGTATVKACIGVICGTSPTLTVNASVSGSGPTITTTSLPHAQANIAYPQQQLAVSGGTSPYRWTVSSGFLPTGLHLSSAGLISGTATGTTESLTVKVTDASSNSATQSLTLAVVQISSVSISLTQSTIAQGATTQATCTATYTDSSTNDCTVGSASQIQMVDADSGVDNSGNAVSSVDTAGVATTAGNGLVVTYRLGYSPAGLSVQDSAGDTFTPIGLVTTFTSATDSITREGQMFYAQNIAASANNVVTCSASSAGPFQDCDVVQFSGLASLGAHNESAFANSNSIASGPITTTVGNEVIVQGGGLAHGSRTFTAGTGYTLDVVDAEQRLAMQHEILLSPQTITPSMTFSGAMEGGLSLVGAFEAGPASSGTNWTSGTPGTALVSGSGLITGVLGPGSSVIQACLGSVCGSATVTVNSGNGTQPHISASPTSGTFGNVTIGTSNSQTITLTNTGAATLTISAAAVSGPGFSISNLTLPAPVAAGKNSAFNAAFSPSLPGPVSGSISLATNAPGSPLTIPLRGTGVAATLSLGTNPASLTFANTNVGNSGSQNVTITNNGNSNITISSVTTAGRVFTTSGVTPGLTLTPNQAATLSVTFTPTTAGSAAGTVTLTSNATNSPTTISLSGSSYFVALSWTASSSSDAISYNVYRGTSVGSYSILNTSPVTKTQFNDTTVAANVTYYYVVTAVDSNGVESADSSPISVLVP